MKFFSLEEINRAIAKELKKLIKRPFQKIEGNRITAFNEIDKPALRPLPGSRYEYALWKEGRIQSHYHVEYNGYFYSVPYEYINRSCSIRATTATVEIYVGGKRIAVHQRTENKAKRYTTISEHMPKNHRIVSGRSNEHFTTEARKIGPKTLRLIEVILKKRNYPLETYRTCMGIIALTKDYSVETIEKASSEAIEKDLYSYKYYKMLLNNQRQQQNKNQHERIIHHSNVRGKRAFEGGDANA